MTNSNPSPDSRPWEAYRLSSQQSDRAREGHRHPGSSPFEKTREDDTSADTSRPRLLGRLRQWRERIGLRGGELLLLVLSALGLGVAAVILLRDSHPASTGMYALIALVPLFLVVWVLLRADRIAPLPPRYLVMAGIWGGGIATSVAAVINSGLFNDLVHYRGDVEMAEIAAATFVAPFSEEILKGIGTLLVLLLASRYIVSVANGVTVGGLVGAGFAFIENIIYFAQAHGEGSANLGITIFGRAVMSPFIHPLATSLVGIGISAALLYARSIWGWIWRLLLGWAGAILIHGMWNGFATLGVAWLALYLLIEMPVFFAWLIWVMRRPHQALPRLRMGLLPYVATGWIGPQEVTMVTDMRFRRDARKWARPVGKSARQAMRRYLVAAGRLGLTQIYLEGHGPTRGRVEVAAESLSVMIASRDLFLEQGAISAQSGTLP